MKLCWLFIIYWIAILDSSNGNQVKNMTKPDRSPSKFLAKQNNDITIKIMMHIDQPLTKKLAVEYRVNTRKKLKSVTQKILEDVRKFFIHRSLNQTIRFKLIDTKFLRNSERVALDENAPKYLKSYCEWQSEKKMSQKTWYYSVLLTGLDLFHVNNGRKIRSNSGRGYTKGICNVKKSCAIVEWDPKLSGFLLAHEIGHSLGMRHDGPPYNQCKSQQNIMALRHDFNKHPKTWSPCSWYSLKQFLKTSKAWCVKPETINRTSLKFLQ
ncbi:unnamed protein product, partial [Brenthis ino]